MSLATITDDSSLSCCCSSSDPAADSVQQQFPAETATPGNAVVLVVTVNETPPRDVAQQEQVFDKLFAT